MQLQFIGATETVTGSKYFLSLGTTQILIDCGLFQGLRELRRRNWDPLPFSPSSLKAVILTHAHIDHSGYVPLLIKKGFRGKIYCSHGTAELCRILLPDSGFLQEEEARYAAKHGFSKHRDPRPLYTQKEAEDSLAFFHPLQFEEPLSLTDTLSFTLYPAGHILGASLIKLVHEQTSLLFTGDLGRPNDLIMKPPTLISQATYVVTESTYGNRGHAHSDVKEELATLINSTAHRGGILLIPSFAVGRAQTIIYLISQLKDEKRIPNLPVYLDSPMAQDVTHLYCRLAQELRLSSQECALMCRDVKFTNSAEESKSLDSDPTPKIIISASGMASGGRVVHHLKSFLPHHKNTIFFVGFQAAGTRGEALIHGADHVKIHGELIPARADIVLSDSLSAHADAEEIVAWLSHISPAPLKTFLTHGESEPASALCAKIRKELGWACTVPKYLEKVDLSPSL